MSVNPMDISVPLLLLGADDWPAAMRGEFSDGLLLFDLHSHDDVHPLPDRCRDLMDFLRSRVATTGSAPVLVRIGGFGDGLAERDLALFQTSLPDGILLSATRNTADVQKLDVLLSVIEAGIDRPIGTTAVLAECGGEAAFFLSPHSLAGKSQRLRGLVLNAAALPGAPAPGIDHPKTRTAAGVLSFARAVCVLKAAEARIACHEMMPSTMVPGDLPDARTGIRAEGFTDVVCRPAQLAVWRKESAAPAPTVGDGSP